MMFTVNRGLNNHNGLNICYTVYMYCVDVHLGKMFDKKSFYIRKMPNWVFGIGALRVALRLSAKTSIRPSSQRRADE